MLNCPVEGVKASVIDWPMTCIRLRGENREALISAADQLLEAWRGYSDPERSIFAETEGPEAQHHYPHSAGRKTASGR